MKISTRGRYALRLMADLANNPNDEYIALKEISQRQEISIKYLEQIVSTLCKAGYVKSSRGVAGGYKLAKSAEEYTVGMILRLIEGNLVPVKCMENEPNCCPRYEKCATIGVWERINDAVNGVVDSITLAELVNNPHSVEFGCKE